MIQRAPDSSGPRSIGLFAVLFLAVGGGRCSAADAPEFLKGVSGKEHLPPLSVLKDLGARCFRPELNWRRIEPEVPAGVLTVGDVKATPSLIDDYIAAHDWSFVDRLIDPLVAHGIRPVAVVGLGYNGALPKHVGRTANPNVLGRANYLGRIYLYARATVRRYKDRVSIWQIENELNEAPLTTLYGWRSPSSLTRGCLWRDFGFLAELLATLADAVRAEAPGALTMLNFHTDIHDNIHRRLWVPGLRKAVGTHTWLVATLVWQEHLDIIGIDAYPNYYTADPVYGGDIEERIGRIKAVLPGKPVVVVETAYPIPREGEFPNPVDWTEEKQEAYVREAVAGARRAGANGFLYFAVDSPGGTPPREGSRAKT